MGIKYKVDESFFENWSNKMAYTLGYLYADGNIEDCSYIRAKYVKVTSIDHPTIARFKRWMDSAHKVVKIKPPTPGGHERYLLRIGSHKMYSDLVKQGLYPNKSLTIQFPDMPKKFLGDFVRGYFDGDGCVFIEKSKDKDLIKRLRVIFTSGSLKFLQKMLNILEGEIQLEQSHIYSSQKAFQLRCSTKDSIKLFKLMYKDCDKDSYLDRKFTLFKNYFNIRQGRIDREISKILN